MASRSYAKGFLQISGDMKVMTTYEVHRFPSVKNTNTNLGSAQSRGPLRKHIWLCHLLQSWPYAICWPASYKHNAFRKTFTQLFRGLLDSGCLPFFSGSLPATLSHRYIPVGHKDVNPQLDSKPSQRSLNRLKLENKAFSVLYLGRLARSVGLLVTGQAISISRTVRPVRDLVLNSFTIPLLEECCPYHTNCRFI